MVFESFYWFYCHEWGFVYGVISYVEILEEKCCAVQTAYFHQFLVFNIVNIFILFLLLVRADHTFFPFYHYFSKSEDILPIWGAIEERHFSWNKFIKGQTLGTAFISDWKITLSISDYFFTNKMDKKLIRNCVKGL